MSANVIGIDPEHGPDIEGMQVEVDTSVGKHTGGIYESGGRGWVIQPTAEGEQALKPEAWNELKISAHGNRIVTWLNGNGAKADFCFLADRGIVGNGHMLMLEDNSDEIAGITAG